MAKLYCIADCEVDLQPYHTGQVLDISEAQAALLLRAAPSSFSTDDPSKTSAADEAPDEAPDETKAPDGPPADKMVKAPERKK